LCFCHSLQCSIGLLTELKPNFVANKLTFIHCSCKLFLIFLYCTQAWLLSIICKYFLERTVKYTARRGICRQVSCMWSSFVRTTINLCSAQNAARTHSTRHNDLRAAIPMQIFACLNAVRLLILRRHFSSLREDVGDGGAAERPSPCTSSAAASWLPRRPRTAVPYNVTSARKLNYVRKARDGALPLYGHNTAPTERATVQIKADD